MGRLSDDKIHEIHHWKDIGTEVDAGELGVLLSEALIARLNKFRPSLRRRILRCIRERLLKEGGVYREFMTGMWGT